MSKLDAIPWWAWVALAVIGLVLLVIAFFLWRRSNKKSAPGPAMKSGQKRLISLWREFLRNLPPASRDGPLVIVLGERLAGKTSLVRAATDPVGQAGLYLPSATEDPRLQFYAGKDRLIEELSGELLEDLRPETRRALTELWQPVALCSPTVLVVLNAASASFTGEGLRELGRLARGKIDRLTELRGSPPRVRVCVTHVDERSSGFVALAKAISEVGGEASLRGIRLTPEQGIRPLSGYLGFGFKSRDTAELEAMERFLSSEGLLLVKALDPFFETLQAAQGSYAPPRTEALLLAAMPEGRAPIVMGDAFALDTEEAEREATRLSRRRRSFGLVAFGVGAATLLALYGVHLSKLSQTRESMSALPAGADKAGEAAVDLMSPLWPPLRLAFPKGKAAVREGFVGYVRRDVLLPLATPRDRGIRAYALSLHVASDGSDLGEQILEQNKLWAQKLGISSSLIESYVRLSQESACDFEDLPSMQAGRMIGLEDWKRFASEVAAAAGDGALFGDALDALKSEAALLRSSLEDSSESEQIAARIDSVASACNLSLVRVEELFGSAETDPKVLAWAQANKKDAQALLDLVEGAKAGVPSAAGKALHEALADLEKISTLPAEAKDPLELTIDDKAYVVDTNAWNRALGTGRATTYARALVSDFGATRRSPFFAKNAYYPNAGAASISGRGPTRTIDGLHTKDAFDAEVKPSLEGLDKKLEERLVQPAERASLGSIARQGASDYGSAYRAALKSYYDSYTYKAASVSALRADVSDMSVVPSWFSDFLLAVGKNAGLGATDDPNLRIITDKLAEFGPIVTLMTEDKGKYPNLEKYTAVLVAMLPSLDLGPPGSAAPRGTPLEKRLAPIGKLGMSVLTGDKSSPYTQVLAWLDDAAIPSAYRQPFLLPVEYASRFGLSDIADAVDKGYRADILPVVSPVLDKFPFDTKAELDADPSNVEAAFGPKGSFFQAFEQDIAPVCVEGSSGEWAPMSSPFGPVRVPADALRLASFATRLRNALWDSGGKPQAIELSVKALPMPRVGPEETVTLSYLRVGNTSIFGFNQTPAFQSLSVPWASSESAGVGLELTTTGGGSKRYLSSEEGATPWSFYRQLAKASPVKDGTASWVFGAGQKNATKYMISFAFPSDPGALFRSPLRSK